MKRDSGLRPFGILLNDPHRAGGLTANTPHFIILLIIVVIIVFLGKSLSCVAGQNDRQG